MSSINVEERVQKAQMLFKMGYNCSQAVFAACADLYGIGDQELALRLAASFGGGIGRMRKTCGAACGMFMLEGLRSGSALPGDNQGKAYNYAQVQMLANIFRQKFGSITCSRLLGLAESIPISHVPENRDADYYQKRPCVEMVGEAVRIVLNRE